LKEDSMRKPAALLAGVIALLALAASLPSIASAAEKSAATAKLEVTYYYLPT
jgi:uncharacterized membrane protein